MLAEGGLLGSPPRCRRRRSRGPLLSSTMAMTVKNILRATGTLSPSNASTPRAKAMSVAIGMPQPAAPDLLLHDDDSLPARGARLDGAARAVRPEWADIVGAKRQHLLPVGRAKTISCSRRVL